VTEEDDEEAKEKKKLAERMQDPEFMPGFKNHIKGQVSAVFGPIDFDFTEAFDISMNQSRVQKLLERTFPEIYEKCSHGIKFQIGPNKRDLTKPSQLLRYSRDAQQIVLTPVIPGERPVTPEPEPQIEEAEENDD
jgi:hypothetical protein